MSKGTLYHSITTLVTMDTGRREIKNAFILVRGNKIIQVGGLDELNKLKRTPEFDAEFNSSQISEIDLNGHLVMPGMVNTHHHMYQTLTRAVPAAQDSPLFGWLKSLYPIWARMDSESVHISTQTAMCELLLSGCTTSSDHLYLYPNGVKLEDTISAAEKIGMRFVATRGSMSIGESKGGLPPDSVVEKEEDILIDSERLIKKYHQSDFGAMVQIALAPCSPFSVSQELMLATSRLARKHGVRLHTHLAENDEDIVYSKEKFGLTPIQYAKECEWLGEDVWFAHCVKLDETAMKLMSQTKTAVAHCPCSNMRLGSGIAPIRKMLHHKMRVGLGVDGSASNDAGHMLNEARQAMLLQRVLGGADVFTARQALELATRGGAETLGRLDEIGSIEENKCADFIAFNTQQIPFTGSWDEVAGLIFCASTSPQWVVVNGKVVVENQKLKLLSQEHIYRAHQKCVARLIN